MNRPRPGDRRAIRHVRIRLIRPSGIGIPEPACLGQVDLGPFICSGALDAGRAEPVTDPGAVHSFSVFGITLRLLIGPRENGPKFRAGRGP